MIEEANKRNSVYTFLAIAGCMLIPIVLSYFFFSKQSLRLDEAQSLWQTSRSFTEIITVVAGDVHVPFYHTILHFWRLYVSDTLFGARILSLLFFISSIPLLYAVGKKMYGRSVGLFAIFLFSISPFMNWYGNEVRMYTLFTFLIILNQFFFVKIYQDKSPSSHVWAGYILSALAGVFTHYFFFLNLFAQFIFYILFRKQFPKDAYKGLIFCLAFVIVSISAWGWYVYTIGTSSFQDPVLQTPSSVNLFNVFSEFFFGFQSDEINTIILSLWPLSIIGAIVALRRNQGLSINTLYLILTILISFVVAFTVSFLVTPIFVSRYLIFTIPALYLLLASFFTNFTSSARKFARFTIAAVTVTMLIIEISNPTTLVKENYREAAEYISSKASMQDTVILSAPFTIYPVQYYYRGQAKLVTLPLWNQYDFGPIPAFNPDTIQNEASRAIGASQNIYVLLSYDQGYEKEIKDYFDSNYKRIDDKNFSNDLNLYVYQIRYDTPASAVMSQN